MRYSEEYLMAKEFSDTANKLKLENAEHMSLLQKRAESVQANALEQLEYLRKELKLPADKDVPESILEILNKKYPEVSEMLGTLKK